MNFIDFITDHLINIDGIVNKHLPGDDQKPHKLFQFHNLQHDNSFVIPSLQLNIAGSVFQLTARTLIKNTPYHSNYIAYVFHPPDVKHDPA